MDNKRIKALFERLHKNKYSEGDLAELDNWYHSLNEDQGDMQAWLAEAESESQLADHLYTTYLQKVKQQKRRVLLKNTLRMAAAILIIVAAGMLIHKPAGPKVPQLVKNRVPVPVIKPARNIAMLTLADGSKIPLDEAQKGNLTTQAGISIRKTAEGKLIYVKADGSKIDAGQASKTFNKIEIPRAGKYELVLPDGSKVWLNAASSLRYPVVFAGNERVVELSGEAYFEVAHNRKAPFRVITGRQTLTVLGTHFNVKGYPEDQRISTTLLQGSVAVKNTLSNQSMLLVPGKQADLSADEIRMSTANVDQVMAWKNGYFIFDNQDIKSIMTLVSRWYDVDVIYHLKKSERFGGTFSRSSNLKELLKNMEMLGDIHFELEERRVTVSN